MFEDQQGDDAWALSDAQDHEFIPLISQEDEDAMQKEEVPEALPILSCAIRFCFRGWSFRSRLVVTGRFD